MSKITSYCISLFIILSFLQIRVYAQNDLEKEVDSLFQNKKSYTFATFKSTRLINFHTIETLGRRSLDFRIAHRFGPFNTGANNFWGLDGPANIRLSLEYSHNERSMIGFGRSSLNKYLDGFIKYKILRQTEDKSMPVTMTVVSSAYFTTEQDPFKKIYGIEKYAHTSDRLSYMTQLILGRKFNRKLSLQISPVLIHFNLVNKITDRNNMYAVIGSGRYKISRRSAITGEYAYCFKGYISDPIVYHNSASLGIDIETGGHVFQIFITNSFAINEILSIPFTVNSWKNGGMCIGFNISRVFSLAKKY